MNNKIDWSDLLNWKLLSGSHEFPGPEGGTCINEAAVVAAGFEYREVSSVNDLPECFSHVLGGLALTINDEMGEDDKANERRTRLLSPFVTRLAGSVDTLVMEERRLDVFVNTLYHDALETILEYGYCRPEFRSARTITDLKQVIGVLTVALWNRAPLMNNGFLENLADGLMRYNHDKERGIWSQAAATVVHSLLHFGLSATNLKGRSVDEYWTRVAQYLAQAFELGNQATMVDVEAVVERVKTIRIQAQAATLEEVS